MGKEESVLLIGGKEKALTVARKLGSEDINIDIATSETDYTPASHSRFTRNRFTLPSEENAFIQKIKDILKHRKYDLLIPLELSTGPQIISNKQEIEKYVPVGSPSQKSYQYAYDKAKTAEACKSAEIPIPDTKTATISELQGKNTPKSFPLIIKHANSGGGKGVKLIENEEQWKITVDKFSSTYPQKDKVVIQEYIDGKTRCINAICKNGEVISAYEEERIHEIDMGPSAYRKIINIDKDIMEYTQRIMQEISWDGPAQIEYRVSGDETKLIEINGRFWGTLALQLHTDINFPHKLYRLKTEEKIDKESISCEKEVYSRNLIRESEWLLEQFNQDYRALLSKRALKNLANQLDRAFSGKEHIDELMVRDPLPFLYTITYMAETASRIALNKINFL